MSVDTDGFINKNVSAKMIYDVIINKIDEDARFNVTVSEFDNKESGFIRFEDNNGDIRALFYCITSDREDLFNDEHVCLSLGYWGDSINTMVEIIKHFGGYLDENDCDDIDVIYIPKDNNFHISRYIELQNKVIGCLDDNLNDKDKIIIANQIIKNKEKILSVLN